jgi:hypothetical protein
MAYLEKKASTNFPQKTKLWDTDAQGIEAVSFFAIGKKDTSVKPGPRARGARMRPDSGLKYGIALFPLPPSPDAGFRAILAAWGNLIFCRGFARAEARLLWR